MIHLNYRDSKPIYEQVKDGIRQLILNRAYLPNEKLPSVRELASKYAINPNNIARAYKELEKDGYIYTDGGKGTYVSSGVSAYDPKSEKLFEELDEIVKELVYINIPTTVIYDRMRATAREEINDRGKECS